MILKGEIKSEIAQRLHATILAACGGNSEAILEFTRRAIDNTIHNFMVMIEQTEALELAVKVYLERKVNLADVSDGLAGELYAKDGWIESFSRFPPSI